MRLFNVRARGVALGRVYDNVALRNPRAAAAHDLGRDPPDAGQPPRRRADEADVHLRSRQRAGRRHRRDAQRQRGVCHRLRRREPDAGDGEPPAEHHAVVVARRPEHRVHVVHARPAADHRVERLSGHARNADRREDRRVLAGVLARRQPHRLHVAARRQLGDLRDEPQRLGRAPAHEQLARPTRRRRGRRPERRSRSRRTDRARRRSG